MLTDSKDRSKGICGFQILHQEIAIYSQECTKSMVIDSNDGAKIMVIDFKDYTESGTGLQKSCQKNAN